VITTEMDRTSPLLAKAAATTTGKKVTIHLMQTGQDQPQCYMEYILNDALVSSYQVSTSADGKPTRAVQC
jgi:type VI protein secretion system component Hcp